MLTNYTNLIAEFYKQNPKKLKLELLNKNIELITYAVKK